MAMDSGCLVFGPRRGGSGGGGQLLLFGGSSQTAALHGVKRPFFSLGGDDLLDDEFYDELQPEKKKRLTPDQVVMLEQSFEADSKLEPERKNDIALKLGLQPRQVAVWFQNRRARHKTKNLEQEFDRLKADYDALLANHNSLIKDNDNLRSQVVSLTQQLQLRGCVSGDTAANGIELDDNAAAAANVVDTSAATKGSTVADNDAMHGHIVDSCGESLLAPGYLDDSLPVCSASGGEEEDEFSSFLAGAKSLLAYQEHETQDTWFWNC